MGKSSKPTIGYWHKMTLYSGHCYGPVDAFRAREWGGEMAWQGNQTASGDIVINQPELFGGEKKEGGIRGVLSVRMGEPGQVPHARLVAMRPGPWPAARGLLTTVYDGDVGAMTPYVKNFRDKLSRWVKGWSTAVWQEALCKIDEGVNPAHIFYQVMTNTKWGFGGTPDAVLALDLLEEAAQALHDEGFGLCLWWVRSDSVGKFLDEICQHVGGMWCVYDDKVELRLFRAGYDPDTLPLIDESAIIECQSWDQPMLDGSVNEVTVVGIDAATGKEISATFQNVASVQAQQRVVAQKLVLKGLWNIELCQRVAQRECLATSMLPFRARLKVKGSAGPFRRGELRALSYAREGAVRIPVRVMEVDEGTATDSSCILTVTQDVNGMADTTYLVPVTSHWTPPVTTPVALSPEAVYEASYRDLAGSMTAGDLAQVPAEGGYLVAVGSRPAVVAYNFQLATRTASAPFAIVASGDFTPNGQLTATLSRAGTSITLANHRDLDLVAVGDQVNIGTEACRVETINPTAGTLAIARGCVDTVPVQHASGTQVWFPDNANGFDRTLYLDGETVDAKLRTRTSTGTLAEGDATTRSLEIAARQSRPYPPARIRIDGAVEPASETGSFVVTWRHRDRLLQADQLVDTEAATIGPEPTCRYALRLLDASDALLVEKLDIAGATATVNLAYSGTVTLQLYAISDNGESWQRHVRTFAYTASGAVSNTIVADTYEPPYTIIDGGEVT